MLARNDLKKPCFGRHPSQLEWNVNWQNSPQVFSKWDNDRVSKKLARIIIYLGYFGVIPKQDYCYEITAKFNPVYERSFFYPRPTCIRKQGVSYTPTKSDIKSIQNVIDFRSIEASSLILFISTPHPPSSIEWYGGRPNFYWFWGEGRRRGKSKIFESLSSCHRGFSQFPPPSLRKNA